MLSGHRLRKNGGHVIHVAPLSPVASPLRLRGDSLVAALRWPSQPAAEASSNDAMTARPPNPASAAQQGSSEERSQQELLVSQSLVSNRSGAAPAEASLAKPNESEVLHDDPHLHAAQWTHAASERVPSSESCSDLFRPTLAMPEHVDETEGAHLGTERRSDSSSPNGTDIRPPSPTGAFASLATRSNTSGVSPSDPVSTQAPNSETDWSLSPAQREATERKCRSLAVPQPAPLAIPSAPLSVSGGRTNLPPSTREDTDCGPSAPHVERHFAVQSMPSKHHHVSFRLHEDDALTVSSPRQSTGETAPLRSAIARRADRDAAVRRLAALVTSVLRLLAQRIADFWLVPGTIAVAAVLLVVLRATLRYFPSLLSLRAPSTTILPAVQ